MVNLKQAILQAWKERWSDYQWAINIKKNFPKGATWDYLNLAGQMKDREVPQLLRQFSYCYSYLLFLLSLQMFVYFRSPHGAGDDWSLS